MCKLDGSPPPPGQSCLSLVHPTKASPPLTTVPSATTVMATNGYQETPLLSLLSVLTTSIHTIEDELKTAGLPTFTLDPKWHPLDSLDGVPPPRLHESRRVAMAAANMIKALVQDVGTAMMVSRISSICAHVGSTLKVHLGHVHQGIGSDGVHADCRN